MFLGPVINHHVLNTVTITIIAVYHKIYGVLKGYIVTVIGILNLSPRNMRLMQRLRKIPIGKSYLKGKKALHNNLAWPTDQSYERNFFQFCSHQIAESSFIINIYFLFLGLLISKTSLQRIDM